MTRTEYARVTFSKATRVFSGTHPRQALDAKNGVKLFRVTGDGRDDLVIEVDDKRDPWDVPWANIASAQPVRGIAVDAPTVETVDEEDPAPAPKAKPAKPPRQPKAPWKND